MRQYLFFPFELCYPIPYLISSILLTQLLKLQVFALASRFPFQEKHISLAMIDSSPSAG